MSKLMKANDRSNSGKREIIKDQNFVERVTGRRK